MPKPESADVQAPPKAEIGKLRPLWRYLRPYRAQMAGALVALIFTSSSVLGMGSALRYLVDHGLSEGNVALLDRALWIMLAVTVLLAVASYARYYLVSWIGERVVADIRRDVFSHIVRMDVGFFETTRTGELLSRLTTDTTLLQTMIGSSVSVALRNALMLMGGFTMLLLTSARLTGYVFLMLPLVIMPIIFLGRKVRQLSRNTQEKVAEVSAEAEETLHAIRAIHALALEEHQARRFNQQVNRALTAALDRIHLRAILTALVIMLIFSAILIVLWMGGKAVIAGTITPGDLSAFVFYSIIVAGAVGAISEVFADLQRAAGATERLLQLLALKPAITSPEPPLSLPDMRQSRLEFGEVSFRYPARRQQSAVSGVSFVIEPGSTVALVGPSGAGKTTIFQLILRFYDPESGVISLGGHDIRRFDPRTLRGAIGVVPQEAVIFSASAMDNILCGRPGASEAEVIEAARQASALEFLQALPQGLHTHLGEKGVQLSGGQRQRISIARALVRNPALLLLDEATSALDSENEQMVQKAIEQLMQARTTLVIAHRLSTVMKADRILLIDEGRLVASGTHEELLRSSPLYARLASLQFDNVDSRD